MAALRAVDALATDLIARGRVLPAPDEAGDGHGLVWHPVLQGPDLVAADTLAAALPPVCRCERVPGEDPPTAAAVVEAALAAAVDAHARARITGSEELASAPDWAHALGAEPVLGGTSPPATLLAGLRRWAVVGAPHAGPARASFRLDEVVVDHLGHAVEDPEPVFRLTFALQSAQDPSLTVDAGTVWRDPTALRRWLDDPADLLLGELGRAARVYPEIGDALRTPRPTGMDLDLAGAHHFLAHVAADLDRAGFGVLLPAGWRGGPARLGLVGAGQAEGPEGVVTTSARLRRDDLVDFSWRLAVDGEALSDDEMDALVRAKAPLVRLRGRWVAVDPDRLRDGLAFLAERRETTTRASATSCTSPSRTPTTSPRRCRWRSCASTARSATSSRAARPSSRSTTRPACTPRCGPTSAAGCRGSRSSPAWASAACSPTTWAWARRCRSWRWRATSAARTTPPARPCSSAPPRWSPPGAGRPSASSPTCAWPCTTAPGAPTPPRRPPTPTSSSPRTARWSATRRPSRASPGTASCSTRPRWSRTTARAARRPCAASTPSTASR